MPNDASGKGSADAASKSRLTKTQLDAILSLAAAGDVEPQAEAAQPDARGAAGAAHVAIWDKVNEVKLSGANAPTTETLAAFLRAHPNCVVFIGQQPSRRAATERSGLDRLADASGAPPSLGEKPPTPREQHAAHAGEEPAKRSMHTPELTRTPQGLCRVPTGFAYQPPALCTYRRRTAARPQGPTYCACWVRAPASGVGHVPRTVATQVHAGAAPAAAGRVRGVRAAEQGAARGARRRARHPDALRPDLVPEPAP
jgi:hypothetical protein